MRQYSHANVIVVGAGIAGLSAARKVAEAGLNVIVLEKGKGVGGRMATRRVESPTGALGRFDHGAQVLSARTPAFLQCVRPFVEDGTLVLWPVDKDSNTGTQYVGKTGLNLLAKRMAEGVDIRLSQDVSQILSASAGWRVYTKAGDVYASDMLMLTAPAKQSLSLLEQGNIKLPESKRLALASLEYASCLAGLFVLDGPSGLPEPGARRFGEGPLKWMADNRMKGISPDLTTVTVHADAAFSKRWWCEGRGRVEADLTGLAEPHLASNIVHAQFHGWRYASALATLPGLYMTLSREPLALFSGDAFVEPNVEGAYVSGCMAGLTLAKAARHVWAASTASA